MRRQFDKEVSTYHSAKSSLTHGLVQRGRPNIFRGKGRILPLLTDTGLPPGPSGSMGPPRHLTPCKGPLLQPPCAWSQPVRQAAPPGAPVPPLEQPFAALAGLAMRISMLPPVGPSPPPQSGWAAQPTVQAPRAQTPNLLLDLLAGWDDNDGRLHLLDRHTEI